MLIGATRIANLIVIAGWALGWIATVIERAAGVVDLVLPLVGLLLWVSPYYLAWSALAPNRSPKVVSRARKVNIAVLALLAAVVLGRECVRLFTASSNVMSVIPALIALLVVGSPLILNIRMLRPPDQKSEAAARSTGSGEAR